MHHRIVLQKNGIFVYDSPRLENLRETAAGVTIPGTRTQKQIIVLCVFSEL